MSLLSKKILYATILLVLGVFVIVLFNYFNGNSPGFRLVGRNDKAQPMEHVQEIMKPIKKPKTLTLAVVGDIMAHRPLVQSGYNPDTQQYDFSHVLVPVQEYLQGDIVLGNLETPIAGDEKGFPGYPMFNAPVAYLQALRGTGFTHLSVSNNHSLDQHFIGLQNTVNNITQQGMTQIGFRNTPDEYQITSTTTPTGMRVGMFAGSYGFNGFSLPTDQEHTLMNYSENELLEIETEINNRKSQFDVLIAYLHIGYEYKMTQNTEQENIAQRLCDAGVRIVIMSHPHVLQPVEWLTQGQTSPPDPRSREGKRESSTQASPPTPLLQRGETNQQCLVAYSMGNFLANPNNERKYTDLGGILQVQVIEDKDSTALNIQPTFIPTVINRSTIDKKLYYQIEPLNRSQKHSWMSDEKWQEYVREVGQIVEKIK
jgi:poly-gamma-glutamate capsule biosynthesis protein CapA/YwtB (metallophosphatase superfamily)